MQFDFRPSTFQTLLGIFWLHPHFPYNSPTLTIMDAFNGVNIVLFHAEIETQLHTHADVDNSTSLNIISTSVVKRLGLDYEPCKEPGAQEAGYHMNRILGKIDLLWHKTNVAMQYPATFHVIESGTYIVTFGRNTLMSHRNDSDRGLYPLFNGQQTPGMN